MKFPNAIPAPINGWLLLAFLVALATPLPGQEREQLEAQRRELLEEIRKTREELSSTKRDRALTMESLLALQQQIERRQAVIATLEREIRQVNDSIASIEAERRKLLEEKDKLVAEYSRMLRAGYRLKVNQSALQFLFSAQSINQAFRRWQYLRQYDRFRRKQAAQLAATQRRLDQKNEQFETQRRQKEGLLASDREQRDALRDQLREKNDLLRDIQLSESQLVAELENYRNTERQLQEAIARVIREEMERRQSRESDGSDEAASLRRARALAALTGSFEENKGRLPWPVLNGSVVRPFGQQPHPTIKNIKITNNGIDIRSDARADVFSVFEGMVAGTQAIPGYQQMVIIQHGSFYTVYSNLEELYVARGDTVRSGDVLGRLNTDKPNLHFEIWREKERLNPVYWISRL